MKRVFVSGPVSNGDTLDHYTRGANAQRAILAGDELRRLGFLPFVPHLYEPWVVLCQLAYDEVMAMCLEEVGRSDALLRLPGASVGADAEVQWARSNGIPVFATVEEVRAWGR